MAYYKDLREHLKAIEKQGLLLRIKREINKDTELHPLVRLQFRGLPEEARKAFLFENVVDSRGRKYSIPVLVAALAGSTALYALGMKCRPEEIAERWSQAQLHPIKPRTVSEGPVHEEVHTGDKLLEHGGLDEFPIPISTPGYDPAPFMTSPYCVSKDPDTGQHNVGTYRVQVKSPTRTGIMIAGAQKDMAIHWRKWKERGKPMPAAIVIGAAPNIGYASTARVPYDLCEYDVAGAIGGEPVELVKCRTVDLLVPAMPAEIVFEGEVPTTELEPEGPFGEALGFVGPALYMPFFNLKCVTHRKQPVWQAFLSQFPPSESSKIRGIPRESTIYNFLKYDKKIPGIMAVSLHEATGSAGLGVIQMQKPQQAHVWQVLDAMGEWLPLYSHSTKTIVVVDEDIDPADADAVNWAISFRVQPHRDIKIHTFTPRAFMDYSLASPDEKSKVDVEFKDLPTQSHLLINATMKWPYPPVSLPKKEFMDEAIRIWQEEKLPALRLKAPWWGYNLGSWSAKQEKAAELAVRGEYFRTGEDLIKERKKADKL